MKSSGKIEREEQFEKLLHNLQNMQISEQEIYKRSNQFLRKLLALSIGKNKDGFLLATIAKAICATEDIDHSKLRGSLEIRAGYTSKYGEDKSTVNFFWTIKKQGISVSIQEVYDNPHYPLERLETPVYPNPDEWSDSDFCSDDFESWEDDFLKNFDGLLIINDTLTGIKKLTPVE